MRFVNRSTALMFAAALIALQTVSPSLRAQSWKAEAIYRLAPNIGLSEFLAQPPLNLQNIEDHNIDLGGIGSALAQ